MFIFQVVLQVFFGIQEKVQGQFRLDNIIGMKKLNACENIRPIAVHKKQDLLILCNGGNLVIPEEFHHYSKTLPAHRDVEDTILELVKNVKSNSKNSFSLVLFLQNYHQYFFIN